MIIFQWMDSGERGQYTAVTGHVVVSRQDDVTTPLLLEAGEFVKDPTGNRMEIVPDTHV